MAMAERRKESEMLSMVPVRIPDYDNEHMAAMAAPAGRPPVERLPENIQFEEQREERGSGRLPSPEEVRRRLPEDISQKAPGEKKGFDVLDEEARSAPGSRRAGKKARGDEGDILF